MRNFESPFQFLPAKTCGAVKVRYTGMVEISQGGPLVGSLFINESRVDGRYGGPCLCHINSIILPRVKPKLFGIKFTLVKINLLSLQVNYLGVDRDIILLDSIIADKVFFYSDLDKSIQQSINIDID